MMNNARTSARAIPDECYSLYYIIILCVLQVPVLCRRTAECANAQDCSGIRCLCRLSIFLGYFMINYPFCKTCFYDRIRLNSHQTQSLQDQQSKGRPLRLRCPYKIFAVYIDDEK